MIFIFLLEHAGLEIREGKGIGVYVKDPKGNQCPSKPCLSSQDLQEIVVDSSEKVLKLIDQGWPRISRALVKSSRLLVVSNIECNFRCC